MKLYGYWRSSSAYRVRIALNLKGVEVSHVPVHLARDGGEHNTPAYRALNPAARVPCLVLDDGRALTQSLAIIDYLETLRPAPALLPADPFERARVRAFAETIACDIQPLGNLSVLAHLRAELGQDDAETAARAAAWAAHWIARGFTALEETLVRAGPPQAFAFGDAPTLADVVLTPQMYNARRFGVDLAPFPRLAALDETARAHPAFAAAAPERQVDAPPA